MPKLLCGDCGHEFWDDAKYEDVKDGEEPCSECARCGLNVCPRCRANHECDESFLEDDDDD